MPLPPTPGDPAAPADPAGLIDPRGMLWHATGHRRDGRTCYVINNVDPATTSAWFLSTRPELTRIFDAPLTPLTAGQLVDLLLGWLAGTGPRQQVHPAQLRAAIAARDTELLADAAQIADQAAAHCRAQTTWPDVAGVMCTSIRDRIRALTIQPTPACAEAAARSRADHVTAPQASADDPAQGAVAGRVTVHLTPASRAALAHATEITGDTRTDTINRAIQTYSLLADQVDNGAQVLLAAGPTTVEGSEAADRFPYLGDAPDAAPPQTAA